MSLEIDVEVTEEHIEKGVALDPKRCPIARALRGGLGLDSLRVNQSCVWTREIGPSDHVDVVAPLPSEAKVLAKAVDDGRWADAEPVSFSLEVYDDHEDAVRELLEEGAA